MYSCVLERCVEGLAADIIPIAVFDVSRTLSRSKGGLHINWSFLLEDLRGARCLVVEGNICADALDKFDLLLRARGRNDLQALGLCELDHERADGSCPPCERSLVTVLTMSMTYQHPRSRILRLLPSHQRTPSSPCMTSGQAYPQRRRRRSTAGPPRSSGLGNP